MLTTIFISKLLGVFFLVTGIAMTFQRNSMIQVFDKLFHERVLTRLFAFIIFLAGVGIVTSHNNWNGFQETLITILGYDMIIESLIFLFVSQKTLDKFFNFMKKKHAHVLMSSVYLFFGIYFFITGFIL